MPHVFISYKHEDLAFAQELTLFVQRMGVPIWLDTNIQPGEEWRGAIDKAIAGAFAVIVIMTPEARLSDYITYEWAFAMGLRIPIIPVLLRPTQLHPKLEVLQYLDFSRGASAPLWIKLIERLQAVQTAQLQRQAQQPQPITSGSPLPQTKPLTMEEEIRQSIVNFFTSSPIENPALVFALAKDIVRQLEQEKRWYESVQGQEKRVLEPTQRQITDLKYTARITNNSEALSEAHNLEYVLALVKVLGLSPETPDKNRIFLQLGMPAIKKSWK